MPCSASRFDQVIAEYDRNYRMLRTFEPFRQSDRMFALVSTDYTATSVLDLRTGAVVATEEPGDERLLPGGVLRSRLVGPARRNEAARLDVLAAGR